MEPKVIEVKGHGYTVYFDFEEWANSCVQDYQVALEIAKSMVSNWTDFGLEEYRDNADEPEYFMVYTIKNFNQFVAQMNKFERKYA